MGTTIHHLPATFEHPETEVLIQQKTPHHSEQKEIV
jgi:hypothetical protein